MNHKVQNYLGIAIIAAVLMLGVSAMSYVSYYGKSIEPSSFRSFSVSGEGKVVTVPDIATFSFGVKTEGGKDIAALQKENTDKMNRAIAYLKTNGIDPKDIKTESYDLEPRYQYYNCGPVIYKEGQNEARPCPPAEIVGYTINQYVSVKVRDFSKIGTLISGIVQNGANTTSGLSFTIDDPTEVQNQARAEAIEKAKAKARAIAKAGGFRLGRLLSIDEGGYGGSIYPMYARAEKAYDAAAPAPSIEPGSKDIVITVSLKYEID